MIISHPSYTDFKYQYAKLYLMCETIDEMQMVQEAMTRARRQREANESKEERPLEVLAQ